MLKLGSFWKVKKERIIIRPAIKQFGKKSFDSQIEREAFSPLVK